MEYIENIIYSSLIYENRYLFLLDGLWMTLLITFSSFILGTLLGVGFCALMYIKNKPINKIAHIITQFFIRIPPLVLLMVMVYILFASVPLSTATLVIFGFSLRTGSYLADIFLSAMRSVAPGETEAARALGMSRGKAFFKITFPQAVKFAMPMHKNQFISTLQDTSIVGYLAVEDLTRASDIIATRTLDPFATLIIVSIIYILIGWIVSSILTLVTKERHLGGKIV